MLELHTPNLTGISSSDILRAVADSNAPITDCERQHAMYDHLDLFLNYFNGVNSTQNLSALLKHDPCHLPTIVENGITIPSSSWIIEFDFWCSGILINLIGMVGILGNSLSLIILSRPQMRSSINYLLIALARCDIILIITSMFLFGFHSIYPYSYYDDAGGSMFWFRYTYNVYPRIIKYLFTLAVIAQTANCYLTLLVSLERYVAVCHPLRAVSTEFSNLIYNQNKCSTQSVNFPIFNNHFRFSSLNLNFSALCARMGDQNFMLYFVRWSLCSTI